MVHDHIREVSAAPDNHESQWTLDFRAWGGYIPFPYMGKFAEGDDIYDERLNTEGKPRYLQLVLYTEALQVMNRHWIHTFGWGGGLPRSGMMCRLVAILLCPGSHVLEYWEFWRSE